MDVGSGETIWEGKAWRVSVGMIIGVLNAAVEVAIRGVAVAAPADVAVTMDGVLVDGRKGVG